MNTVDPLPFVTIVLPVRNEAGFIARSLGAVLNQDYPHALIEVLVADGMSTDATRELVTAMAADAGGMQVILLDNPGRIVATGLNAAVNRARGDIIIRVDGHTVIAPDYVRECIAALRRSNADNVGGRMDGIGGGLFSEAVTLATRSRFGVGGSRFHYADREMWVDTVYMGAWPRRVFQWVGKFDEELVRNQDDEFNYRLRSAGGRILLSPRISSLYYTRSSPRALWRQYFQYGFWKVRVMQKHPRQMSPRHFAPALFIATMASLLVAAPFVPTTGFLAAAVALAYLTVNVISAAAATRRREWRLLPTVSVTFTILHLSYGSGFLAGLLRFATHWARPEQLLSRGTA